MFVIDPDKKLLFDVFCASLTFLLGLCIGSFANVCIYRMPDAKSVALPRSCCPHCGNPIAWYDNIPLLSICLLGGRCRSCREKISKRYFLVELLTGALFLIVWFQYGFDFRTPIYWMVVTALIIGTFIDFDYMILPDQITVAGIFAGLALSILVPALHGMTGHFAGFKASFIGMLVGGTTLWLVGELGRLAFKKDAMGMGDVKLLAALGAFLGWQAVVFIIMFASLTGAVIGTILIMGGNKTMGSKIPFGPCLAFAATIWILGGYDGWFAYLHWLRGEAAQGN